ncbi:MAG: carboxypeptidase-like regulatory domain-containing protein, partial [Cyclobacteriaceae bacterium]|nr:carboxypeptidase-like regulatory domain-containing protein [Cyclobacteriaceae bacterium]
MRKIRITIIISYLFFFNANIQVFGQNTTNIYGIVIDNKTDQYLIGVNIIIKDKLIGTITDTKGNYVLSTRTQPPFTLVFSIVGYESVESEVTSSTQHIDISMSEKTLLGQEVVVSASRVEENIVSSPVSIEKMGIIEIQQNSTANFYDGLYQLKGVDMNVNSLTFRFPNTRGFTGDANYRMNQLVDGIENISPGLSFAAGNMFGLSELDVESVELLVGASSALYGPGGMNGTLLMKSKNPFEYQGLSFVAQTGVMHLNSDYKDNVSPMFDISFRYAKAI